MWQIVPYITSGVTLMAFLAALGAWLHRSKLKNDLALIESAPQDKRDALIYAYLGRFEVDTGNLTKQQQHDVVVRQINGQSDRFKWLVVGALAIAFLFTCLAVYAIAQAIDAAKLEEKASDLMKEVAVLQHQRELMEIGMHQLLLVTADTAAQTVLVAETSGSNHPLNPELRARVRHLIAEIDKLMPENADDSVLDSKLRLAKAGLVNLEGRFEEGLRIISKLEGMQESELMLQALDTHANSMFGLGRWQEALLDYQKVRQVAAGNRSRAIQTRIATCRARLGKFQDAFDSFSVVIDDLRKRIHNGDQDASLELATSLSNRAASQLDAGEFSAAIADLDESVKLLEKVNDPSARLAHAGAVNNRGLCKLAIGELSSAIRDFEQAIAISSQLDSDVAVSRLAEVLGNMGVAYIRLGERTGESEPYETSLDYSNRSIDLIYQHPQSAGRHFRQRRASAQLNRAVALFKIGRREDAMKAFDEAIEDLVSMVDRGAGELEVELAHAYINRSTFHQALDKRDEALADLNRAVVTLERLNGQQYSDRVTESLATSLLQRAKFSPDFSKAIEDCDRAIDCFRALIAKGRDDLKEQLADSFNARGAANQSLNNFSAAEQDFELAIATLRELIQRGRDNMRRSLATALMNRASILDGTQTPNKIVELLEGLDESILTFRELIVAGQTDLLPDLASALMSRGIWHRRTENAPKAFRDYNEAIEIYERLDSPTATNSASLAKAYHNRASLRRKNEEWELAIEDYSNSIQLRRKLILENGNEPERTLHLVDNLNWRGDTYRQNRRFDRALSDFNEAMQTIGPLVDQHPQWNDRLATSLDFRGKCHRDQGHLSQAINDWEMAIRRLNDTGGNKNWLVDILVEISWILAAHPDSGVRDGKKAKEYASQACSLTNRQEARPLDCLAAAHAEQGDFELATTEVAEAIQAASESEVPDLEIRLALYREGRAFIDQELEKDGMSR